jgi:tetratricopeptide (TPR) repeat protein
VVTHREPPDVSRQRIPLAQAFERAVTLHHLGRLDEAERTYRAVLELDPDHFGALLYLGVIVGQHDHLADAELLIRHALMVKPNSAEARNNLGIVLAGLDRSDEALVEYEKAVALDPRNIEARNNLGNMLHRFHRSAEAILQFEQALALRPDVPELHNNLGNALRAVQGEQAAIVRFHQALALRPHYAEAHNNLGVALAALGKYDEAVAEHERAIAAMPHYFEAHNNLGNAFAALRRRDEAISHFGIALKLRPDAVGTHNSYGNLLVAMKRHDDAIRHYRTAIELQPDFFEAYNNLGNALAASGRPADAVAYYRRALEINPGYPEAHGNLGNVLAASERYDEAVACFHAALAIDPQLAEVYSSLGHTLVTLGRIDEGRNAIEKAIALDPRQPEYYRGLGECKPFTLGDPHLSAMETLARSMGSLAEDQRIVLHYVLAKAYDDIGRHEAAFHHMREGSRLKRGQVDYDETEALGLHRRVIEIFTAELMQAKAASGAPSSVPVFVVGMPRSGTTLIEQILASHHKVFGAGETTAFDDAVTNVVAAHGSQPFPEAVPAMSAAQMDRIGENYVGRLTAVHAASKAPQAERIVDKALGNFVYLGLIHLALPSARIIHISRDPADTCFSCFSKMFAGGPLYSYDFGELGRYYRSYVTLMAHWRAVLPQGVMLEVRYEDVVTDLESKARTIIAHCGLDWDDRCLAFHTTQRSVRTASAVQVRRPIYRSSVGRWRPYEKLLQPLLDELRRTREVEPGTM